MLEAQPSINRFHHFLHGYSDGHTLLAASSQLSPESDRLMFMMSDMSGPSMVQGFDCYVTGYPLPKNEGYAIAMTWYAPEMKRPGCVFTHTIVIENSQLHFVQDMKKLLAIFRRPGSNLSEDIHYYKQPVEYFENEPHTIFDLNSTVTSNVIKSLYELPNAAVFIPHENSKYLQGIILEIWAQQWPKLRRSFSFCTGSLAPRKIFNTLLELQVIPDSYIREAIRDFPNSCVIEIGEDLNGQFEEWNLFAVNDLTHPSKKYRNFLKMYDEESKNSRSSFIFLTKVYLEIERIESRDNFDLESVLSALHEHSPSINDNKKLKKDLFCYNAERDYFKNIPEETLITNIISSKWSKCLPPKALKIAHRAEKLYIHRNNICTDIVMQLLKANTINAIQSEFIKGVFTTMGEQDALIFSNQYKGIFPTLLKFNPGLIESSGIWNLPDECVVELAITAINQECFSITAIEACISSGKSDVVADIILNVSGSCGLDAALNWQSRNNSFIGWNWVHSLREFKDDIIRWYVCNDIDRKETSYKLYTLFALIFNSNDFNVSRVDSKHWINLALNLKKEIDNKIINTCYSFLVSLSFSKTDVDYAEILAIVFEPFYSLAATNIDYKLWETVNKYLPHIEFKEWDRCEKLRRGIIYKYIDAGWSPSLFLETVKNEDALARIVQFCSNSKITKKFIKTVRLEANNHNISATNRQIAILNRSASLFDYFS